MAVHLINPSDNSFGTAVITPRWLFVLAAATPAAFGDPILVDESIEPLDPATIASGDVVGISVHTGNALRGYEVGRLAHERGATATWPGSEGDARVGFHAQAFVDQSLGETGHGLVVVGGALPEALGDLVRQPNGDHFTHVHIVV